MQAGRSYGRRVLIGGFFCGICATVVYGYSVIIIVLVAPGPKGRFANATEALQGLTLFPFLMMAAASRFSFPLGFAAVMILSAWWEWGARRGGSRLELGVEMVAMGAALSLFAPFIIGIYLPGFAVLSGFVTSVVVGGITAGVYAYFVGRRTERKAR